MKKLCSKCKQEKETTEFSPNNRNKDGLHSYCKQCRNIAKQVQQVDKNKLRLERQNRIGQHLCPDCGEPVGFDAEGNTLLYCEKHRKE